MMVESTQNSDQSLQIKKTILLAHKDIGNIDRGGVCTLFKSLASGLSRRNWNVHVVTALPFVMEGVEVHQLDPVDDFREYSKKVSSIVEQVKPDIAESSTWRAELLDYSQSPRRSSKIIVRADPSAGSLFSNVQELSEGEKILCQNADLILAVSDFARRDIQDSYGVENVHVVYNGIPENEEVTNTKIISSGEILDLVMNTSREIEEIPIEEIVKPGKINIMWIGKPTRMKGFDLLEKLVESAPDDVNFIINTGYSPSEVTWNPENYKKCTFIRALTKSDQLSILKASNLFISTSRKEGFGIVVAEALREGLPVLLNEDCEVYREFLPNDGVELINVNDQSATIQSIFDKADKKIPESRNPRRFSQEQMIDDSIYYYESLFEH